MSSHTAASASSASRGRTRDAHGRFSGSNNHQWRSPLPRPTPRECRYITDAEVLERVAQVLDVELVADLDKRRLRRLNSVVNRYKLERKALAATKTAERYTSRDQVAVSLYGPDVDLNSVKRQMRRLEAILALAGLLEVRVLRGDQGEDRGLVIRLLDPLEGLEPDAALAELAVDGRRAQAVLAPRPERRGDRRRRRHRPWCRQQSDRARCGGVPGAWVRRRDLSELLTEIATPGSSRPGIYGTTSLSQAGAQKSERDASAPPGAAGVDAALEATAEGSSLADAIAGRAGRQAERPRSSRSIGTNGRRDREGAQGPGRWAALSRFRQIALRERGPERLLEEGRLGAPPCSIAVAIFEAVFVAEDGPLSWGGLALGDGELEPTRSPGRYRPIGPRWAQRLEVACRQIDRLEGPGAGIAALVEDVIDWRPGDGAPRGAQHNRTDAGRHRGDVTVHTTDPGWPVSLAYFIRRLQITARARRRDQDPRRRLRSLDWRIRQERGELTQWGQTQAKARRQLRQERDYFARFEELEADDHAARRRLGLGDGELPF